MLWGLLQESNIFDGIENEKYKNIQNMFEDTIDAINKSNTTLSLLEKNKMTMETLLKKITDEKSKPKKNIQMIYKAEDLQDKRQQEFNIKLKEHEESMNSLINPSKPKEVSFSDEKNNEDKPIGDEMDRLIAERLASRERELEIPSITKEAEEWLSNNSGHTMEVLIGKKVSFNKNIESDTNNINPTNNNINPTNNNINPTNNNINPTNNNINPTNNNINPTQNTIFNKLKRKSNELQTTTLDDSNNISSMNIEYEIKIIKDNQEKILSMCSDILSIIHEK